MRPIDGDAVMNVLNPQQLANKTSIRFVGLRNGRIIELARLLLVRLLEITPTLDVEPVRHGRWKLSPYTEKFAKCTVCEFVRDRYTQIGWNYCPHCGAKMDLKEEKPCE